MDGRVRLEVRRDESVRCVERRKNGERGEGEKGRLRVSFSSVVQMIGRVKADPDQLPRLSVSFYFLEFWLYVDN